MLQRFGLRYCNRRMNVFAAIGIFTNCHFCNWSSIMKRDGSQTKMSSKSKPAVPLCLKLKGNFKNCWKRSLLFRLKCGKLNWIEIPKIRVCGSSKKKDAGRKRRRRRRRRRRVELSVNTKFSWKFRMILLRSEHDSGINKDQTVGLTVR